LKTFGNRPKFCLINCIQVTATDIEKPIIKGFRRIRYSGKYPKTYKEKYKEMQGDELVINKVISKGGTPAGTHISVMVNESIKYLGVSDNVLENNLIIVDCTMGYGGHSLEIMKQIFPHNGQLFSIDQDSIEIKKSEDRLRNFINEKITNSQKRLKAQSSLHVINTNFQNLEEILKSRNITGKVNGLLADLGFSSMQIDNPERGFTYKQDGPLDMRMNSNGKLTAAELLRNITANELSRILSENSDESNADNIARCISKERPETTLALANCVRKAYINATNIGETTIKDVNSAIARTMQAIRIEVNNEFQTLDILLESLPRILAPGGRAVFLTFHSGEDRRVKKAFKKGFTSGIYSSWSRDVVRASFEEQRANPRSKCAKLR